SPYTTLFRSDPTSCRGSHSARCSAVLEPLRTPNGIRTRVTALKGRRPRPLDDGGPCVTGVKHRGDLQQHQSDCPRTPPSPLVCGKIRTPTNPTVQRSVPSAVGSSS